MKSFGAEDTTQEMRYTIVHACRSHVEHAPADRDKRPRFRWSEVTELSGLRPANERRRYFVTTSLIGWAQA